MEVKAQTMKALDSTFVGNCGFKSGSTLNHEGLLVTMASNDVLLGCFSILMPLTMGQIA